MGLFSLFQKTEKPQQVALPVRARYDAAQTSDDRKHWAAADAFSADAALSPVVRRTIRNRARYERNNNSYLAGISSTLASDLIGTLREPRCRRPDRSHPLRAAET